MQTILIVAVVLLVLVLGLGALLAWIVVQAEKADAMARREDDES